LVLREQPRPLVGATNNARSTGPVKPPVEVTVIVTAAALAPSATVTDFGLATKVKSPPPNAWEGDSTTEATIIPMMRSGRKRTIVQFFK